LPDGEHSKLEIDIGIKQMDGFRNPQTGRGHQAKQGFIGCRSNTARRSNLAGSCEQLDDFLIMEDVWGDAACLRTEDRFLRNLGLRFELLQVTREMANSGKPGSPSCRCFMVPFIMARPLDHEIGCQWAMVMPGRNVAGKPGQQCIPRT